MRKRAGIVAVSLLFVAAGCGDGEDEAGDAAQVVETEPADEPVAEEPAADEPAAEPAAEPADEPTEEPTEEPAEEPTEEPAEEPADDSGDTTFTGGGSDEWCVAALEVETLSDALDSDTLNFADPAAVEAAYTSMLGAVDEARAVAPPEIATDVETTYTGFTMLADTLAAADWNILDADLSVIDELDAQMTAAGDRIGDYNEQICGIPQDDDDDDVESADDESDFDPSAGTAREQMAVGLEELGFTAEEAACIVDEVDLAGYIETEDTALILDAFVACDIPIDRLAELGA